MNQKIYSIDEIKREADIATARSAINWEVLECEPEARAYFVQSLEWGINRLAMVERVYVNKVLAHVDPITMELDTDAAKISLETADTIAEELHACYSMKGILETYHSVLEVTGGFEVPPPPPPAKKKRAPRRKKDSGQQDGE